MDYLGQRSYDSQIGRLLSVDRFAEKYPSLSPYSYAAGNPIRYIDYNGDSLWIDDNGNRILYSNGMKYSGTNKTVAQIIRTLNSMGRVTAGGTVLTEMNNPAASRRVS